MDLTLARCSCLDFELAGDWCHWHRAGRSGFGHPLVRSNGLLRSICGCYMQWSLCRLWVHCYWPASVLLDEIEVANSFEAILSRRCVEIWCTALSYTALFESRANGLNHWHWPTAAFEAWTDACNLLGVIFVYFVVFGWAACVLGIVGASLACCVCCQCCKAKLDDPTVQQQAPPVVVGSPAWSSVEQ